MPSPFFVSLQPTPIFRSMPKLGIICAMQKEMDLISGYLKAGRTDSAAACELRCVLSGIGKVNAAVSTMELLGDFHPDAVLSLGVAGSFADVVNVGDIILASATAYHDVWCGDGTRFGQVQGLPKTFTADPDLLSAARRILPEARIGLICSGDQFYISREEDQRQKALYPDALAVDMESAAIAQVCHLDNIPFLSVRAISDVHNDGRQKEHYSSFWKEQAQSSLESLGEVALGIADYLATNPPSTR